MLPGCLEPSTQHVDELIVVDTGSTDRTVEIAESFGAKVLHFPWNGSFSDARNVGLDAATGDWILYLDADEHVVAEDAPKLRALLGETWREGFYLAETNYTGGDESGPAVTHMALRLFRNRPEYRFVGRIHEQKTHAMPLYPARALRGGADARAALRLPQEPRRRQGQVAPQPRAARARGRREAERLHLLQPRLRVRAARRPRAGARPLRGLRGRRLGAGWAEVGYASVLAVRLAVARRATGDLVGAAARDRARACAPSPDHTDLVLELAVVRLAPRRPRRGRAARAALPRARRRARRLHRHRRRRHVPRARAARRAPPRARRRGRRRGALTAARSPSTPTTSRPCSCSPPTCSRAAPTSAEVDAIVPAGRPSAMMLAGTAFHEAGRVEDAERWFRATLERQPSNGLARVGLVEALLSQRRYAEAAAEADARARRHAVRGRRRRLGPLRPRRRGRRARAHRGARPRRGGRRRRRRPRALPRLGRRARRRAAAREPARRVRRHRADRARGAAPDPGLRRLRARAPALRPHGARRAREARGARPHLPPPRLRRLGRVRVDRGRAASGPTRARTSASPRSPGRAASRRTRSRSPRRRSCSIRDDEEAALLRTQPARPRSLIERVIPRSRPKVPPPGADDATGR